MKRDQVMMRLYQAMTRSNKSRSFLDQDLWHHSTYFKFMTCKIKKHDIFYKNMTSLTKT